MKYEEHGCIDINKLQEIENQKIEEKKTPAAPFPEQKLVKTFIFNIFFKIFPKIT